MNEPRRIVEISGLTVAGPTGGLALDRFSLTLDAGERVVILGENGCGKEALIAMLGGFGEKLGAMSGTIRFAGGEAVQADKGLKPTIRVAYLPSPLAQPFAPHASVLSQLCRVVARKLSAPLPSAREELRLALERMPGGLPLKALDRRPGELDSVSLVWGMMAAVGAQSPDLVLVDHLLADLGPSIQRALLVALASEQNRLGYAMLYATGGVQPVARLGGRIIVMRHGHVIEEGDFVRLASGQVHAYTRELFKALPQLAAEPPRPRNQVRGQPLLQVHSLDINADPKKGGRSRNAVTFELSRGAALALVGEDGSGRRALMRAVLGLDRAPAGRVIFDAVDVNMLTDSMRWRLRRRMAFIDGTDEGLDPRMTVRDAVDEPLRAHLNLRGELVAGYRESALKRVGLTERDGRRRVDTLSSFEKRRLQVARAIVSVPLLTVIDEPLRGLDAFEQTIMREVLADFRATHGPAFLIITSDLTVAQSLADEALVFERGKVVERGTIAELIRDPREVATRNLIDAAAIPGLSKRMQAV